MTFTYNNIYEELDLEFEIEAEVEEGEVISHAVYFKDEDVTNKIKKEIKNELLVDVWGFFEKHLQQQEDDYYHNLAEDRGYGISGGIA